MLERKMHQRHAVQLSYCSMLSFRFESGKHSRLTWISRSSSDLQWTSEWEHGTRRRGEAQHTSSYSLDGECYNYESELVLYLKNSWVFSFTWASPSEMTISILHLFRLVTKVFRFLFLIRSSIFSKPAQFCLTIWQWVELCKPLVQLWLRNKVSLLLFIDTAECLLCL